MNFLLCLVLGLTIGGLSGALGIGGGVLLLPALMWLFELKQGQAAGITLAVLAVPVTLPGVWQYYQRQIIQDEHLRMAACIAIAFAVGTFLGGRAYPYLPAPMLRLGFGLLMIYVALRFIISADSEAVYAAAGLTAMGLALLAYLGLRALGRRHLPRPDLGDKIRAAQQRSGIEYHI